MLEIKRQRRHGQLVKNLKTYKLTDSLNETKIILNYDRRALIKYFYKLKNNNFEVFQYESNINKLIFDSHKEITILRQPLQFDQSRYIKLGIAINL